MPLIGIVIYLVVDSAIYFFRPIPESWMELYVSGAITLVCAFAALMFLRVALTLGADDRARRYWGLLTFALVMACIGHMIYMVYGQVFSIRDPFPFWGDAFFLVGDLLLIAGVWLLLRDSVASPTTPEYSGEAVAILAGFLLTLAAAVFVVMPTLAMRGDAFGARLLTTSFVILDVILFTLTFRLASLFFYSGVTPKGYPGLIFAVAFALMSLSDCFWWYLNLLDRYHSYHWINIAWVLGYLLVSHAGLAQARLKRAVDKGDADWETIRMKWL